MTLERTRSSAGAAVLILGAVTAGPVAGQTTLPERAEGLIRAYHDLGRFNGAALVVYDGEPLVEKAYGVARIAEGAPADGTASAGEAPNRVDTRFPVGPLTESFTAALALRLAELGTLDLDAPVRDYIPEPPIAQDDRMTIHDLLTGTSPFEHADSGYVLLGGIAERVTGRPYRQLVRELVLDPAGLDDTGYDRRSPSRPGHARGYTRSLAGVEAAPVVAETLSLYAGLLYSTVADLGRWARALARFEPGRPFETPETLERMQTLPPGGTAYGIAGRVRSIGREDSVRVLEHTGGLSGFSIALRVFPDHDRVIVLLDNMSSDLRPLLDGLTNVLWGAEAPRPKPSIAERLLPIVETAGVEAALDRFRNWRRTRPDRYDYGPGELVRLAGHLAAGGRAEQALPVLETAIELHPRALDAALALFELRLTGGDTARAISALEGTLTWRPGEPLLLGPLIELGHEPPAALRMPVADVPREALDRVTGAYRIDPATTLDIRRDDEDGLVAQRTGEAAFPLLPQSETIYLLEGSAIQLAFRMDGDRAESVTVVESGQRVTFPRIPAPR